MMWSMLWPILVVVTANTMYNISSKSTPHSLNPLASLSLTYFVAMIASILLFLTTSSQKNILLEWSRSNWASYVLGLAVVGLEFGFLYVYRAGWKISTAHLVASIMLAVVLLLVGVFLFRETLTPRQLVGLVVCGAGLALLAR